MRGEEGKGGAGRQPGGRTVAPTAKRPSKAAMQTPDGEGPSHTTGTVLYTGSPQAEGGVKLGRVPLWVSPLWRCKRNRRLTDWGRAEEGGTASHAGA